MSPGTGPRRARSRGVWIVIVACGLGLLLMAAVSAAMTSSRAQPRDFGVTSVPSTKVPAASAAAEAAPARPSRTAAARIAPAVPVAVTIPALGVEASVQPVGTSNGELGVPTDPAQLGWWTGGARVGATNGTVVIDGHVDSAATGPGALFRLQELHVSDRIQVTTSAGGRQTYVVTGRRVYVKANPLPPELFATDGPARLVLITCGGPFDRTSGNYLDNIVVFATPT